MSGNAIGGIALGLIILCLWGIECIGTIRSRRDRK